MDWRDTELTQEERDILKEAEEKPSEKDDTQPTPTETVEPEPEQAEGVDEGEDIPKEDEDKYGI